MKPNGETLAVGWFDKRPVCLLTNIHSSTMMEKRIRDRHADGGVRVVHEPNAIENYNRYMGSVAKSEQNEFMPLLAKKSIQWWRKIFFHLFVTSLSNAYVV